MSQRPEVVEGAEAKQKVTLYLPPELHRNLKIRAAVEREPMSAVAEKALTFYLLHPEVIEGVQGSAYRVHRCPECGHPFVIRNGEVVSLHQQSASEAILEEVEPEYWGAASASEEQRQDELVPC
ncbi:hypothetical protein ACVW0Q_001005 [Thermostichus sp. MS-CIW-21]|jgi:hypothetical protein|uniref:hypothetical protein n=1 Tax=unclassified Synechococcus TaxID=2626047 RepID=UPI000C19E825|nr:MULTISPECIES: hypothetical protein [unclassified Synechococcus]PIK85987.1 hypothetical protein SYN63AY4M2_05730 [Synechococcus sp. 63AY4M2]PIK95050.1 hypothetical protein SYN60AY4M2_06305 [Synechococcus sp. 60AY4M2]PIL01987.1 hypothetical protein SYN65AY640_10345 [Synechococcus sp. 65AY640]